MKVGWLEDRQSLGAQPLHCDGGYAPTARWSGEQPSAEIALRGRHPLQQQFKKRSNQRYGGGSSCSGASVWVSDAGHLQLRGQREGGSRGDGLIAEGGRVGRSSHARVMRAPGGICLGCYATLAVP